MILQHILTSEEIILTNIKGTIISEENPSNVIPLTSISDANIFLDKTIA